MSRSPLDMTTVRNECFDEVNGIPTFFFFQEGKNNLNTQAWFLSFSMYWGTGILKAVSLW